MSKFIEVKDIKTERTMLINVNHIETITSEAYGTTICLALQNADSNEPNIIHTSIPLTEIKKNFSNFSLMLN